MTTDFIFRILGVIVFAFAGARLGVDVAKARAGERKHNHAEAGRSFPFSSRCWGFFLG